MVKWHNAGIEKPPQGMDVLLLLADGSVHEGRWLKDANKYVRGVNRWRIYRLNKYVLESDVNGWVTFEEVFNDVGVRAED